jgi:hypothetical protein
MAGRPFQSRLTPHFELIAALRRQRKGWQEITDHLATLGVKTDKGNLCAFFKRHRVRPASLGTEAEILPHRRTQALPAAPHDQPDLSDLLPQPSEFGDDLLPIKPKKMWSVITPTQNP